MSKETLTTVIKTKKFAVVVTALLSTIGGTTGGYLFAKTKLEQKYSDLSEREIHEAKEFYQQKAKAGDYSDPTVLAEKYEDFEGEDDGKVNPDYVRDTEMVQEAVTILKDKRYVSYDNPSTVSIEEVLEVKTSIAKNIFDSHETDEDFDFDVQGEKRDAGRPYIVEEEEFDENEDERSQTSLKYFDDDDVLVDENDQHIRNVDGIVGSENLLFGHGSKNKDVVYIANDQFDAYYEVTRVHGSYSQQVLGLKHTDGRPPLRKFNRDWD